MRVTVEQEFRPSFRNVAPSEGSVQVRRAELACLVANT